MIKAWFKKYRLQFIIPGGTSRGVLHHKDSWFLFIQNSLNGNTGVGECSIIEGLSIDNIHELDQKISELCSFLNTGYHIKLDFFHSFPALLFAYEMAMIDLKNNGIRILFPSKFTKGQDSIIINGLIWMGSKDFMFKQIKEKIENNFTCIKMKIGSISFDDEIQVLQFIRNQFSREDLEIRVDANGAFSVLEAKEKLKRLSDFDIHSIEQPIKPGQLDDMADLCKNSSLSIALDEELIDIYEDDKKENLLKKVQPQFIIIKPSLLGGLAKSILWIEMAKEKNIDWWVTSALESNIGLNAISQWTYSLNNQMPQGLGTGQLFSNNIKSPLIINNGRLEYTLEDWDLSPIL